MSTPIELRPGTIPYDCWPSPQQYNVDLVTRIVASLNENFPGVYVGNTEPPPEYRDRVWFHTDSTQWYYWISGAWQRKFYPLTNSKKLYAFWGDLADLASEDVDPVSGALPVGNSTGPLWQVDSTMEGRMFIGAGDVPGSDPVVTLAAGAPAGAGSVILVPANFQHFHGVGTDGGTDDPPNMLSRAWSSVKNFVRRINDLNTSGASGWHDDATAFASGTMGSTEPYPDPNFPASTAHANLPPVKAGYWIKRTARIYVNPPY